jgi:hypothetical protein
MQRSLWGDEAFLAFSTFLNLGPERSLAKAAEKLGRSMGYCKRLSSLHQWPARVAAHDFHNQPSPLSNAVMRTGRTRDLGRRGAEHGRDPNLRDVEFEPVHRIDVYNEQRGLEQMLHDKYQPPLNKIRPISPTNPKLPMYQDAAKTFLEQP